MISVYRRAWSLTQLVAVVLFMTLTGKIATADPVVEVKADLEVTGVAAVGTSSPDAEHDLHVKGRILAEDGANNSGTSRNKGLSLWTDEAFGVEAHYSNSSWQTAIFGRKSDNTALTLGAYDANETAQQDFYHYITIENSGDVGIGTTNPLALLEVNKDQNAGTAITVENDNTGTGAQASLHTDASTEPLGVVWTVFGFV